MSLAKMKIPRRTADMKTTIIHVLSLLVMCLCTIGLSAQTVPCSKNGGARFNLEPRQNAVFQNTPSADFILNGAGPGDDLIVQTATDWRGAYPSNTWDGSMSGYYVHASSTADCSVQFEGGLPNTAGFDQGLGEGVVVADATRQAFFIAEDQYIGGEGNYGIFRASVADLLNPQICPPGTHTTAQAMSCWEQTPPVFLNPQESFGGPIGLAVDQRSTGTGAGDVYLVGTLGGSIILNACTNATLACSTTVTVATNQLNANIYPSIQVRSDGIITISSVGDFNPYPYAPIIFVTCTPAGAPNPPTCQTPVNVTTLALFEADGFGFANINLIAGDPLYPKHANRRESNGQFTTFLVYDQCVNSLSAPPPPNSTGVCLNTQVNLTLSQDGGQTWSTPVVMTPKPALHFFSTITNDASTETVSIAYYSTEGDPYFRNTRVFVSQIAPGSTTPGAAQPATVFTPIDDDPGDEAVLGTFDYRMGIIAHGTGTVGQSHLYLSFDSETVDGTYNGAPLPELNNHIELIPY
jgi:hypothetical protein